MSQEDIKTIIEAVARDIVLRLQRQGNSNLYRTFDGIARAANLMHEIRREYDIETLQPTIFSDYRIQDHLDSLLRDTRGHLEAAHMLFRDFVRRGPQSAPTNLVPTEDIIAELESLPKEFKKVNISQEEGTISIITDDVVMEVPQSTESVNLGPFEIKLYYKAPASQERAIYSYKVIPLEPHYPRVERNSGSRRHPHPNMNHESLCEGDGIASIVTALKQSRLGDFFMIVNSILNTYGASSPYYPLEAWERVQCRGCGGYAPEEDFVQCSRCRQRVCRECAVNNTCEICQSLICQAHHTTFIYCEECGKVYCKRHFKSVRKHKCFKEIRDKWRASGEKLKRMLKVLEKARKEFEENGVPELLEEDEATINAELNNRMITEGLRQDNPQQTPRAPRIRDTSTVHPSELTGPTGWVD